MEAIAALSLACNVIQVLGVGHSAITLCKDIYKDGRDVRTSILQETSRQLNESMEDLKTSHSVACTDTLYSLSEKCQSTAQALQRELEALIIPAKSKTSLVLGQVLKSMVKAKHIAKLKEQLDEYEKVFNTQIMIHLW